MDDNTTPAENINNAIQQGDLGAIRPQSIEVEMEKSYL